MSRKILQKTDITIADFLGIDEIAPEMNDNRGTSLVITRTKRGQNLFDHIKESLEYKEVEYDETIKHNFAEHRSVSRPEKRDNSYNDLNILSFEQMGRKYGVTTYVEEIRQKNKASTL